MRTIVVKSLLAIPILVLLMAASAHADSGVKDARKHYDLRQHF
jgi:hypothetical protein